MAKFRQICSHWPRSFIASFFMFVPFSLDLFVCLSHSLPLIPISSFLMQWFTLDSVVYVFRSRVCQCRDRIFPVFLRKRNCPLSILVWTYLNAINLFLSLSLSFYLYVILPFHSRRRYLFVPSSYLSICSFLFLSNDAFFFLGICWLLSLCIIFFLILSLSRCKCVLFSLYCHLFVSFSL